MTNTRSAIATGLPTPILPFPTHLARPPLPSSGLLDRSTWDRCFAQANAAEQFRDMADQRADATVHRMVATFGAQAIADALERNAAAIGTLRAIVASLVEDDRRLAAAADRLLQAEGI